MFETIHPVVLSEEETTSYSCELKTVGDILRQHSATVYGDVDLKRLRHEMVNHEIDVPENIQKHMKRFMQLEEIMISAHIATVRKLVNSFYLSNRYRFIHLDEDDYFQQACMAVYNCCFHYDGSNRFSTLVYHATKRSLIDFVKLQNRRSRIPATSMMPLTDSSASYCDKQTEFDAQEAISEAGLTDLERELILAYMHGDSKLRSKIIETRINPKTGGRYNRTVLSQIFKKGCNKIKLVVEKHAA